jgi:hypothetical protein
VNMAKRRLSILSFRAATWVVLEVVMLASFWDK